MMKAKILLGGILLATLANIVSPILSDKAFATGETYQWVTQTQIKATGGIYNGATYFTFSNNPPEKFADAKASFIADSPNTNTMYKTCNSLIAMLYITSPADITKDATGYVRFGYQSNGQPRVDVCNDVGADIKSTVHAASAAPGGATTDCSKLSGAEKEKCQVIKDCVNSGQRLTQTQCEDAYNSCTNGASDAVLVACKKEIAKGNIDYQSIIKSANTTSTTATDTCNIQGVGWLVCPVMTFLAKLNDGMFQFLSDHFLNTNISLYDTNSGTYRAWQQFRNYANIAFVIVFLFIIYSQITSAGINNYGIKRMLPRLIVGAILVNVSYFVCQLAVDLSNVLGYGLKAVFDAIPVTNAGKPIPIPLWETIIGSAIGVTAAIAATVALAIALGGTVLVAALLAFGMITLILVAREAFIVLLIAMSPLAFVAYLLPNTEQWFKKWWKALWAALLVFPIISVIFGASSLASRILLNITDGPNGDDSFVLKLTALGVLAIPFFAVPSVLKGSMAAAGTIGARLQGMGDRATGRLGKSAKNTAKTRYDRSSFAQGRALRKSGQEAYRRSRFASNVVKGGIRSKIAGGLAITPSQRAGQAHLAAAATQADFKAFDEHVSAEKSLLSQKNVVAADLSRTPPGAAHTFDKSSLDGMVRDTSLSVEQRAAAASRLIQTGADSNIHEMLDYLGTTSDKGADTIQKQVASDLGNRKPKSLGNADVSSLATGTYGKFSQKDQKTGEAIGAESKFDSRVVSRIHGGKQSGESLASASADELARIEKVLASTPKPAAGTNEAANRAALATSIDEFYTSAATSGRQVPNEIKMRMDSIKSSL